MLSFLSSLIRFFSSGVTIGSKKETKNDSSKKSIALGSNNTINETNIDTQNIIHLDSPKNESFLLEPNSPCKELINQADSFMKQIAENEEERLLVFRRFGKIERIRFIKSRKDIPITDKVAIPDVLKFLKEQGYLNNSWNNDNNTRHIYDLTLKGRYYGKKLLEENSGNTPCGVNARHGEL